MTRTLLMFFSVLGLQAAAQDNLEPAMEMFFQGMKRHEFSLVSNSATRCGSLLVVVGQVLTRDTSDTETAAALSETGEGLIMMGLMTNGALLRQRGKSIDMNDLQERSLRQVEVFTKLYVERMTANQASTGEMWSNDELLQADLTFCNSLTILFSDEWTETLTSNNWRYWDEAFQ